MKTNQRQRLNIVVLACAGIVLLDRAVIGPATERWREQNRRITELRQKVQRGRQLLEREETIRGRWADMIRANLPVEVSAAENEAFKAVGRWARESRVNLSSLTPQWQTHEEGYETLECRVSANGDQSSLGRFLYEAEVDGMPVNIQECELTPRDARGTQLTLTARVTFLRLATATTGRAQR